MQTNKNVVRLVTNSGIETKDNMLKSIYRLTKINDRAERTVKFKRVLRAISDYGDSRGW